MFAVPATALALANGPSQTAANGVALQASMPSRHVAYHRNFTVSGRAPLNQSGQVVSLELQPAGSRSWHQIATARVRPDGSFRLKAWLRRSGALRAVGASAQAPAHAVQASSADPPSAPEKVWVRAKLQVPQHAINVLGNQPVSVNGRLLPGQNGRHVALQELRAGRWYTVASTRTSRRGNFGLRYVPGGTAERRLRVKFAGDPANTATSTGAGTVTVYQPSAASWYNDAGATACGFHSYYGVANLSLPCGTKVNFYYHGRAITAVVQDRGPYTGGRSWDLNQNLAQALGFNGVDTVWTSQ
jgi:hypothetical protein